MKIENKLVEKKNNLSVNDKIKVIYKVFRPGKHRRLIILIHGMASNLSRWSEFVEHTTLKDSWDIIRIDMRGHGESQMRGILNIKTWCRDLSDILDSERYQQAVIAGHSLGAQVAYTFASLYPSRTMGIVLIDPVFHGSLNLPYQLFYYARWLVWPFILLLLLLDKLGFSRSKIIQRDLAGLDKKARELLLDQNNHDEMISQYSSPLLDLKFFPISNYIQELIATVSPLPKPNTIEVPSLAILASAPTYTNTAKTKQILNRISDSETEVVDAYHWPLTERPDETRILIENWCNKRFNS